MTVQRGGSTWKPAVTPVGTLPRAQPLSNNVSPVTKTSLAAQKQDYTPIGASHNMSPKGFSSTPHVNGDAPKLVNKQYNTPIGLYSEQSIAETLSAQAEVLSTGALGVNFKKNEKNYDAEKSEVYKMLQEAEREPRTPEPAMETDSGVVSAPATTAVAGLRHVTAPIDRPQPQAPAAAPANTQLPPGQNICADCERLIVGVFVRIKDKNLHVECFKCATCGTSLKNVGYYNINNKLYCDIHAKLAARSNPPAPNMVPVTIPPGGKVPAGTISAALASHSLPSPSPLSPSGNQVAAPFSPHSKQDSLDRYSPNNNHNPKVDAVANLMSALTMATQKEFKENGTNTDTVYLTEKIIPINNSFNNNDNNGVKEEQFPSPPPPVKYMPYRPKSASSFTGPKPFSSMQPSTPSHAPFTSVQPSTPVAAPIAAPLSNTLPRTGPVASLPERKEWPPSKSEDIPTASPLYIDPSSRNPTPQPKVSNPHHTYIPVAQNPTTHNPQNPLPQITNPQNTIPQMIVAQNPIPQITISQNPHSVITVNETNMSKSQVEKLSSEYKSTQEVRNIDRNMSICSAEVTNITGRRSVTECVETVSGAVDTQMLVNHVTKLKERPKSPPPLHRKDSVYDTQDICIVVSTKTPGGKNPTTKNPVITVDDKSKVNIEDVMHSSCNPGNSCNPNICKGNPVSNPCPMSDPDCTVKITCPRSNPICPINIQENTTNMQSTANVQHTANLQSTANVQDTSKMSQKITSSKVITNPVPQQYISPMVKALTVASDRPFNTVSVEIKSKEYGTGRTQKEIIQTASSTSSMQAKKEVKAMQESRTIQETKALQQNVATQESKLLKQSTAMQNISLESKQETTFPHVRAPVAATPLASALTVAPSKPFTHIPQFSMDPVSLPPQTTPYFPPEHPITIEPKVQVQPVTCQSPFVQALTTAPNRPYTPLAGTGQEQSDPDFMKDIPAPSRQKMTMLTALTTASERPFTPALSVGSVEDILLKPAPEPSKPHHKQIPAPPPMPITVKPASHTSPSAFRPIGNSAFKPITQSYKPQISELPKVVTSFPPVSYELKSTYAPSTGFSYSTPSKVASQQNTKMPTVAGPVQQISDVASQQRVTQYASETQEAQIQQARKQSLKSLNAGLQAPSSIPGYQKNIRQRGVETQQMIVPQFQVPIQKPVTTLQPGQYQPNNHLQTFQPVMDENHKHYMRTNSPLPRAVSPSMINHPAPSIPYYQADLVAHECVAVETNIFDPRSPAISRSPSPCPGARSTSPFPRTMTKSPAQGPPPNPLADRIPKMQPVRSEKYLEAKQNLSTFIPKYQGKDNQVKSHLSTSQIMQSRPRQFTAQSQFSTGQSQVVSGQSQFLGGQAQIATQSETYQNIQMGHSERQQQNQMYKMSEVENVRHMEQLNKSQMQSVETSADNRIQIQRSKRCTEEYERTQKEKTIEIHKTGSGQTQIRQSGSSVGGASSIGFQRQTSLTHPTVQKIPAKPVTLAACTRSYSVPGTAAVGPKQFKPSPLAATTPKAPVGNQSASRPNVPQPYSGGAGAGGTTGRQSGAIGVAPKRGRGVLNLASAPGSRVPMCGHCNMHIRGPFITALGKIWCPEHFICTTPSCRRPLQDMGFVEEKGQLYCEFCFEQYLAPICGKCNSKIKGDCLNAIGKHYHPECFACAYCSKLFGNSPFFLEDGLPYCEADWNELFTTKCFACGFPVEAGDRWVEALNNNYHSQCFNCTMCKKNLEGQSFYAKGGRPFCKNHAR